MLKAPRRRLIELGLLGDFTGVNNFPRKSKNRLEKRSLNLWIP